MRVVTVVDLIESLRYELAWRCREKQEVVASKNYPPKGLRLSLCMLIGSPQNCVTFPMGVSILFCGSKD